MLDQLCEQFVEPDSVDPSLWGKLRRFLRNSYLERLDASYVDRFTLLYHVGNRAVHELRRPSSGTLEEALRTLDDALDELYSQPDPGRTYNEGDTGVASGTPAERRCVRKVIDVPSHMAVLYDEMITACNENLKILCVASVRPMFEALCRDRGEPSETLFAQVRKIEERMGPVGVVVEVFEFANGALHRCETGPPGSVRNAVVVVEWVLEHFYAQA